MTADEPTDLIPRLAVTARLGARDGDAFFSANREAWLGYVVNMWRPYFEHAGAPLPVRIYVSVGRPARDTSTGVCFPGEASDDGYPHIFIHPVISDSTRAAGTLVHQLCHAALGNRLHDAAFKRVATTVGLIGRMTRTVEGPFFVTLMVPAIVDRIGPYPNSSLRQLRNLEQPPRSKSRLLRVVCPQCGYRMRVAAAWLRVATPLCPNRKCPDFGHEMDVG
jgi:hypothetical protein